MKKNKVILFCPGYEGMSTYHWFPFPYLYIGPFLEQAGYEVKIVDARVEPDWENILRKSLTNALCLGITAMTGPDLRDAIKAVKICRKVDSQLPVIWGGPHAMADPEQTIKSDYVDIVVCGQGEQVLVEIARRISNNKHYNDIQGIAYKKNDTVYKNNSSNIVPFDHGIFPGYHLIDIEKYRSENNVVSIFTARGCPYRCSFCTTGKKSYCERTLDQVEKEILFLVKKWNFKNIFIQDGTYFFKKKRVMELAKWIIDSGLEIKWKAKARADSLLKYSDQELSILKKSGVVSIFIGLESGSDRVLKRMRKGNNVVHAEKTAKICHELELELYTSFMFCTPFETIADLMDTINHIKELKKNNPKIVVQNCIYLPLPGTPMYDQACNCGYNPPSTLEDWMKRNISSRFEERNDITWIPSNIFEDYIKIYNKEFGVYKHLWEKERDKEYVSVFKEQS